MKLRAFSLLLLMATLATSAGIINKTYNFSPSQVEVSTINTSNGTKSMVNYDGLDNYTGIGMPSVPVKSVLFKVPDNAVNISVTAQASGGVSISLTDSVYCTEAVTTSAPNLGSAAIQSNTHFPSSQAELTNIGYVGGDRKVVAVNIYPVSVSQDQKSLTAYSKVTVKITYSLGNDTDLTAITPTNPSIRNETAVYLKSVVENPILVDASPIDAVKPLSSDMNEYDYIIITPREYAKHFERLAAMRRTQGYGAMIFALEEVLNFQSTYHPYTEIDDDAGRLRYFLKYAYQCWGTRNVLLAGRYPEMPIRFAWLEDDNPPPYNVLNPIEFRIPSDLYFKDLNSNWYRGEKDDTYYTNKYTSDVFTEINVGRLNIGQNPEQEITNYIDKVKTYEFVNPKKNGEYLGKAVMTMSQYDDGEGFSDVYYQNKKKWLNRIYGSRLHDLSVRDENAHLTGSTFINFLNTNPVGCLALFGHGNPGAISLDKDHHGIVGMDEYEYWLHPETGNGLDNLTTIHYPSWMFSVGCFIMPHDYEHIDGSGTIPTPYHFADAYTIANPTGGIALLGNTRSTWVPDGNLWTYHLLNSIEDKLAVEVEIRAGELLKASLYNPTNPASRREYYVKSLVGDPLCRLFVKQPQVLQASENTVDYNGEYRTYNINYDNSRLYVGCAPIIDPTYAYRIIYKGTDCDSIINYNNT
ncbi:MAG: hypothetical protein K2L93_02445, partial [Muribaculaceae bacterium]|nr:hypothetical protein [Muribaculaceae bacterium]